MKVCVDIVYCAYRLQSGSSSVCNYPGYCDFQRPRDSRLQASNVDSSTEPHHNDDYEWREMTHYFGAYKPCRNGHVFNWVSTTTAYTVPPKGTICKCGLCKADGKGGAVPVKEGGCDAEMGKRFCGDGAT